MALFVETATVLIIAYVLGSIPTALIVSTRIKHIDIRSIGDGNMGARNIFHVIGSKHGVIIAIIDISKGALSVYLAYMLGLNLGFQMLAGIFAIIGHDYPIFANFKGGQGTATSLGTMLVLFPVPTFIGVATFGAVFLVIKNFNISCGTGGAIIALILGISHQWLLLVYAVAIFLFIPAKLLIDNPRRRAIEATNIEQN